VLTRLSRHALTFAAGDGPDFTVSGDNQDSQTVVMT
jgi:hypothetical protein